jgi:hypothetical protein
MPVPKDGLEIYCGWTVVRIEAHGNITLTIGYLYVCPNCSISVKPKQTSLLGQG